jgi:hypothetical protein
LFNFIPGDIGRKTLIKNIREIRRCNPETQATSDTKHGTKTSKAKNSTQITNKISNMDLTKKPRVNPDTRKE